MFSVGKLILSFLFVCVLNVSAFAERITVMPESVKVVLDKIKNSSGSFSQEKNLKDIKIAISSSGRFKVINGQYLEWNILQPIPISYKVTPRDFTIKVAGVETRRPLPQNTQGYDIWRQIQLGDYSEIFRNFIVDYQSGFNIKLIAKTRSIAEYVRQIFITGDATQVRLVTIYFTNGDIYKITFDNVR